MKMYRNKNVGTLIVLSSTHVKVYVTLRSLLISARMVWRGPRRKKLRPENRRCTLVITNSSENQYLRQKAVRCLADHEIGTHFVSLTHYLITEKRRQTNAYC